MTFCRAVIAQRRIPYSCQSTTAAGRLLPVLPQAVSSFRLRMQEEKSLICGCYTSCVETSARFKRVAASRSSGSGSGK
jgi:hypothetical protein